MRGIVMPVMVEFPDGVQREVPSTTRYIESKTISPTPRTPVEIEEPDYDPEWRFVSAIGNKWFAKPRR